MSYNCTQVEHWVRFKVETNKLSGLIIVHTEGRSCPIREHSDHFRYSITIPDSLLDGFRQVEAIVNERFRRNEIAVIFKRIDFDVLI